MKPASNFLVKTIKAGIFFILPVTLILLLCGKVIGLLRPIAHYLSKQIDKEAKSDSSLSYIIAILLFIALCFLCGLLANSSAGKSFIKWIETHVLNLIPGYQIMKNSAEAAVGIDSAKDLPVVLAPIDGWMITFLVARLPDNQVAVFVPGSPSPW